MTELIHLDAGQGSIVIEPIADGAPVWRHCGRRVAPCVLPSLADTRTPASFSLDRDCPMSTAPVAGSGWFGPPAIVLRRDGAALNLAWTRSVAATRDGAAELTLTDDLAGIELVQTIRRDADAGWRIGARVINAGLAGQPLCADGAAVCPDHQLARAAQCRTGRMR